MLYKFNCKKKHWFLWEYAILRSVVFFKIEFWFLFLLVSVAYLFFLRKTSNIILYSLVLESYQYKALEPIKLLQTSTFT